MKKTPFFGNIAIAFFTFLSLITSFTVSAKLSGIYTINGSIAASSTNYKTFSSAVSDLDSGKRHDGGTPNGSGVDSAVVFKIADGSYNESLTITAIKGASSTKTITFQSASGDSLKVKLNYLTASSNYCTVNLNGAKYIHFNQMTISTDTSTTAYYVINIENGASYNAITNCRITGISYGPTLVNFASGPDTANTIQNNFMKGCYWGVFCDGSGRTIALNNNIIGNIIDSAYSAAILINYGNGFNITGNTITNVQDGLWGGIIIQEDTEVIISNNIINIPNGGCGISVSQNISKANRHSVISNNMITVNNMTTMLGTGTAYAIAVSGATYTDIFFNSLLATSSLSGPLYIGSNIGLRSINIENNIGYNSYGGQVLDFAYTTDYDTMDYNDWYTTGNALGNWGNTLVTNISDWITTSGVDSHSISVNPQFVSSSNLNTTSPLCYRAGIPVAVKDDIHGNIRNALHPCIGANEYTPLGDDAGITAIDSPDGNYCHAGIINIYASIYNFGLNTLTGAQVGWSVNGVAQTSYFWTGSLSAEQRSIVNIGAYSFAVDSSYIIKVWTANPNGVKDSNTLNDTSVSTSIKHGMSGTYIIGATSPSNYTTIAAAIADLTSHGVCGPVTFNIEDGNYYEQDSINAIPGTSIVNTVTFQSKSGDSTKVIWSDTGNSPYQSYDVMMNGASYVTFRQITFNPPYASFSANSSLINFGNGGSHNLTFTNNRFIGYYSSEDALLLCENYTCSNIIVSNNLFKGGGEGIELFSSGNNIVINNNRFDSAFGDGIYIYNATQTTIANNSMTNIGAGDKSYTSAGIGISEGNGAINIYNNSIEVASSSDNEGINISGSGPINIKYNNIIAGSYTYYNNGMTISCNGLLNISYNRVQVYAYYAATGITATYCIGSASTQGIIYNNFVSCTGTYSSCLAIDNCNYQNIYFNNLQVFQTSSGGEVVEIEGTDTTINIEDNNIISDASAGYALYLNGTSAANGALDYNNIYAPSSNIAYLNNKAYPSLNSFITASGAKHTIAVNPYYRSNINLYDSNTVLLEKGTAIPGVTTDIYGYLRYKTPTIGAVEILDPANDAAITGISSNGSTCSGNTKFGFTVQNFGVDALKSIIINWQVNSVPQPPDTFFTKLLYDSSTVVSINYNFKNSGNDTIKAWASMPNNVKDTFSNNDTVMSVLTVHAPAVAIAGNQGICKGDSIKIGAAPVSGNTYAWMSHPSGYSSTNSNPSVSPTSTTTYYLNESISTGCSSSDSVVITVNPLPTANPGTNQSICLGANVSIGSTAVSGNAYFWTSNPTGFTSTTSNPSVSPTTTTTYYLTETITATGCSNSDTVIITVNPLPTATTGTNQSICFGSSTSIGATAINGNSYSWTSNPSGFTSTSSNPSVSPTTTTTYYITETITATGCSNSDSVIITVNPLPVANAGTNQSVCYGDSASIGATTVSGHTYSWSSSPGGFSNTASNVSVSPIITTTYDLTETITATGCSKSDSVIISVNPLPNASFSRSVSGYVAKFSPTDSTLSSYNWSFGDGDNNSSQKPTHAYASSGTYEVVLAVKNKYGCIQSDSTSIVINPKSVTASFSVNYTNCTHTSISFTDSSKSYSCGTINHWLWAFGDGATNATQNPSHTYSSAGVFAVKLTVSSSGGCSDSFTKNIFVDSACVWPGDANNDKIADTIDVLYIGIAYGETGAKRSNASTNWDAQYCGNWANTFANGANHKHADCNGDGIIDSNDISVVNLNWGDTHPKTGLLSATNPANPPFFLIFSKTTYNPGDTVNATIMLGSSANPLTNVYGMASAFKFDLTYVDTNTLKINFNKSWFGTPGSDMLYFLRPEYKSGTLLFAITRIDHKNTSGNGNIGAISFIIPKIAPLSKSVNFTPGAAKLIAFNQTIVPISLPKDTFAVQTTTGIQTIDNQFTDISIYPNPASSTLTIESPSNQIQTITIYDAMGRVTFFKSLNFGKVTSIPVSNLSSGIYTIKLGFESGSYMARFMKE